MASDLVEVTKVIAWPLATVLGGCSFAFIFRKSVSDLIGRATSVGKEGLKADPPTAPANQDSGKPSDISDLSVPFDSQIMPKAEELIVTELKDRNLLVDGDTCKILVRQLASANIQLAFERIHRRIFGSQFYIMKKLNERRVAGLDREYIGQYFARLKQDESFFDEWDADNFMSFLIKEHLVFIDEDDNFTITDFGVEFLVYVSIAGLPEPRGL